MRWIHSFSNFVTIGNPVTIGNKVTKSASSVKARKQREYAVIRKPLEDAQSRYHKEFLPPEETGAWQHFAAFRTTSEFSELGRGYRRHCGPTALTNLLLTLNNVQPNPQMTLKSPSSVFMNVARIGQRHLFYVNTDFLHHFGGSSWFLMEPYLKAVLADYGYRGTKKDAHVRLFVRTHLAARTSDVIKALHNGSLVLLQLYNHPVYGNHDVMAYGYTRLEPRKGKGHIYYLNIADGWSGEPRYLASSDIKVCGFFEIGIEKPDNESRAKKADKAASPLLK